MEHTFKHKWVDKMLRKNYKQRNFNIYISKYFKNKYNNYVKIGYFEA